MGEFSVWHWLVVLAIVALIFGTRRLREVGGDVGVAVRSFREALKDDTAAHEAGSHPASLTREQSGNSADDKAQ